MSNETSIINEPNGRIDSGYTMGNGVSADIVRTIVHEVYGVEAEMRPLVGYVDTNFLAIHSGGKAVLKISAEGTPASEISYRTELLGRLSSERVPVPVPTPVPTREGVLFASSERVGGRYVRMLAYLPGRPLAEVNPQTTDVARAVGTALSNIDLALLQFEHPAMHRYIGWDLANFPDHRERFDDVASDLDTDLRELIGGSFDWFGRYALSEKGDVRHSVIHNDANDYNVLFSGFDGVRPKLSGIIDFGDSTHTELINESAIALAYLMMSKLDPLSIASAYVASYCDVLRLNELELKVLFPLIKCRLSTTLVMAASQARVDPGNEYYQVSAEPARALLRQLAAMNPHFVTATLRDAAGYEPAVKASRIRELLKRTPVSPVLESSFDRYDVSIVDLSVGSDEGDAIEAGSAKRHTTEGAPGTEAEDRTVLIGRYDEPRIVYRADQYDIATDDGGERRTVHLGIDVFQPAGTSIRTPLPGTVYGLADNDAALDYGPTVVLRHELEGETVFSLFGHLSRESLLKLEVGDRVAAGAEVGRLGTLQENGGWVPHVHYQLILDMLGEESTFPGVARPSQSGVYRSLCPDPNVLLRLPTSLFPPLDRSAGDLLAARSARLGPNLSLSYREPLHIVRGEGTWLVSSDGQRYLDCVNNVCHVGHSHPKVAAAIARQASVLNTNTRYLHRNVVEYAEALCAKLPEPLSVCYFVCSGSEANDLALRLARAYTGRHGVVALESGYHGNLTSLVEISSYKFDGPGGEGAQPHVELGDLPDPYRGRFGADASGYVASVDAAFERLASKGIPAAAFIAETILSCGGQVEPPQGYLKSVYRHARREGAVCIADEVQIGFGRMGTHFWGFETQGVVPDIVTLGKPIGNGHPIGAVVTTREIADAFDNGMEYFNTYGGNPVSCAAAQAVLDIIAEESLQGRALEVGSYFMRRLEELKSRFDIIGDVRGRGLFLGIELVCNRETLAPAAEEAAYVVNRMRSRGVLLSTDGPLHNVIKIKPPMVFSAAEVDRVIAGLSAVLQEDFVCGIGR